MRKKMLWIVSSVCIVIGLSLMIYGESDYTSMETPEEKVKAAYLDMLKSENPNDKKLQRKTIQDMNIEYYGNIGGNEFFLGSPSVCLEAESAAKLGGYTFHFSSCGYYPNYFLCLTEEGIFTVKDAYEEGIITQEDLYELAVVRGDIVELAE